MSKRGLIMQGGAMRGLFTCGVIDVLMENGIEFDGAIGVSAGAVFGCNIKSKQIDRPHRYNIKYAKDKRMGTFRSWITSGDVYNVEFCYKTLPYKLDLFDIETYKNNPMDFYACSFDIVNGVPVYKLINNGDEYDIKWLQASASMPLVSRIVEIDGMKLLDGGCNDSIPIKYFESIGYDKNILILTREKEYREQKGEFLSLIKLFYRKYPNLIKSMKNHPKLMNETFDYIESKEKEGKVIVIRPEYDLNIKKMEKDIAELERVYQHGREVALKKLEEIRKFLKEDC